MSGRVRPGDLAVVVLPTLCCGNSSYVGAVGRAAATIAWAGEYPCSHCGDVDGANGRYLSICNNAVRVERLKRIDPPAPEEAASPQEEAELAA